jgi:hypothetical protein
MAEGGLAAAAVARSSSTLEGAIEVALQKQDFRLPAAIDAIATGNVQLLEREAHADRRSLR